MARTYTPIALGQQSNPATDINQLYQDVTRLTQQMFNVKEATFGAAGDGVSDDTSPIQAAINAATAAGGGVVFFPDGHYLINGVTTASGLSWGVSIIGDNITLQGTPAAIIESTATATSYVPIFANGAGKPAGVASWASNEPIDATVYAMGAAVKGATSVTLTTPANAANFAVGDWVFLRTGQVLSTGTSQPDAEYNRVASSDVGTGIIGLQFPTAKPYAQEYFLTGTTGWTSTTVTANLAIFGIANVTDRVLQNFAIRNLDIRKSAGTGGGCFIAEYCMGVEATDCTFTTVGNAYSGGSSRDAKFLRNRVRHTATGFRYAFPADFGSSDYEIAHNRITAAGVSYQHIHEGCSRIHVHHNHYLNGTAAGADNTVSIRGRGYDIRVTDNLMTAAGMTQAIFVNPDVTGGGIIARNTITGNPTQIISCAASGWDISDNLPHEGTASYLATATAVSAPVPNLTDGIPTQRQMVSSVFVADDFQNPILVRLPGFVVVDKVTIDVTEAFNSDGTDTISIGTDANNVLFGTATDVSTGGLKTVTAGTGLGRYQGTAQVIEAYYVNGGSEPTTGKALVEVYWHRVARQVA